jgi:deoxyhypusine synthase
VSPENLPDSVICYLDVTVALPLLTVYALARQPPRPQCRLMDRLEALTTELHQEYASHRRQE